MRTKNWHLYLLTTLPQLSLCFIVIEQGQGMQICPCLWEFMLAPGHQEDWEQTPMSGMNQEGQQSYMVQVEDQPANYPMKFP